MTLSGLVPGILTVSDFLLTFGYPQTSLLMGSDCLNKLAMTSASRRPPTLSHSFSRVQYSREVSSGHPDRPAAGVLHAVGGELLERLVVQP